MARKRTEVVEIPAPAAAPVPVEIPAPVEVPEVQPDPDPVPTYTLRADRRIDIQALVLIGAPESVIREFELYEERHR